MPTDWIRHALAPLCVCAVILSGPIPAQAQVRISEFMASNSSVTHGGSSIWDEDGNASDWIEIENISPAPVNLVDWALTDDSDKLSKWSFPNTNLPPGGFLIVFASDKNRRSPGSPLHTNFKLGAEGEYLALVDPLRNVVSEFAPYPGQATDVSFGIAVTASNVTLIATGAIAHVLVPSVANGGDQLGDTWTGAANEEPFDHTAWTFGTSGVGFNAGLPGELGLNVQGAMQNQNASAFVRLPFSVTDPAGFSLMTLRMALIPPARSMSSMWWVPEGATLQM